jgi:hypothetical protein
VIQQRFRRALILGSLIVVIAGAAIAVVPDYARAQTRTTPWRIGVLTVGKWPEETVQEFRQALGEAGYSEGRTVAQRMHRHALVDPGRLRGGMHGAVELTGAERFDWIESGKQPAAIEHLALGTGHPPPGP